ncbi:hypothetical protein GCM10023340_40360 [Nocardioides marinquilinus]|uniref:FHA domain-containing protein n=1 Tax=Nocardioides marinquilinus TaxID=1210400 RepID=A0ABP9Q0S2_9ACTN
MSESNSDHATGASAGTWSYRPGTWFGVFGAATTLLLPASEKARVGELWSRIDDGAGFDDVLEALLATGLGSLPGFVLISSGDGPTKVLVRGASVHAHVVAGGDEVDLDGSSVSTWVERTLHDVTSVSVTVDGGGHDASGGSDGGATGDLPIHGGLVRVGRVDHPPYAPVSTDTGELVDTDELETEADDAAGAVVAPAVVAGSDADDEPVEPLDEPVDEPGDEPADEPAGPAADDDESTPPVGLDLSKPDPDPEPDPATELLDLDDAGTGDESSPLDDEGETLRVPGEHDALADPLNDPLPDPDGPSAPPAPPAWPDGPPSAPPSGPPSGPPSSPPPFAPPSAPPGPPPSSPPPPPGPPPGFGPPSGEPATGEEEGVLDHDGLTRAGVSPLEFSRPQPGIPGQPMAPSVVSPVAKLVISSGETIEVDRVVLIGRAPEARRFTSTDQPKLVTVPSPLHEISSTHIEVRPGSGADHGSAVVTDMGSTNGTVLEQPGLPPEDLKPGIAVQLIPGATINLGDGVTISVTNP